jgi:hypothetical protein
MYRRVERQARRMHDVIKRLDVDAGAFARHRQGETYAEARRLCLFCGSSDRCLRWLEDPNSPAEPAFCPNMRLYAPFRRPLPGA